MYEGNLVCHAERKTWTVGVREQVSEENTWSESGLSNRKLEKIA
jgi:hypothetical protein